MYAAKSTACFCIISTVVLSGPVWVFFCAGNDVDLGWK